MFPKREWVKLLSGSLPSLKTVPLLLAVIGRQPYWFLSPRPWEVWDGLSVGIWRSWSVTVRNNSCLHTVKIKARFPRVFTEENNCSPSLTSLSGPSWCVRGGSLGLFLWWLLLLSWASGERRGRREEKFKPGTISYGKQETQKEADEFPSLGSSVKVIRLTLFSPDTRVPWAETRMFRSVTTNHDSLSPARRTIWQWWDFPTN